MYSRKTNLQCWDSERERDREPNVNMIAPPRRIYCKLILNADWKISAGIVWLKWVSTATRQCAKRVPGRKLAAENRASIQNSFPHARRVSQSTHTTHSRRETQRRKTKSNWNERSIIAGILCWVCEKCWFIQMHKWSGGRANRRTDGAIASAMASALSCGMVHLKRPCLIATYLFSIVCADFYFHSEIPKRKMIADTTQTISCPQLRIVGEVCGWGEGRIPYHYYHYFNIGRKLRFTQPAPTSVEPFSRT